jgi:hypothetical protein
MARTSYLYLVVMAVAGLTLGALDHLSQPQVFLWLPPLFWLLLVSLLFDLLVRQFGAGWPALAMATRLTGFLSGALLYFLVSWMFGTPGLAA